MMYKNLRFSKFNPLEVGIYHRDKFIPG